MSLIDPAKRNRHSNERYTKYKKVAQQKKLHVLILKKRAPKSAQSRSSNWYRRGQLPIYLTPAQKPVIYDLDNKESIKALTEHLKAKGIEFIPETKSVPLQVVPIAILGGQFGVIAKKKIRANTLLGYYRGQLVKGEKSIQDSAYAFELTAEKDIEQSLFIDGRIRRNFGALLNHSSSPNCETILQRGRIKLQVDSEAILAGMQCFISYGSDYFPNLGIQPLYLDPYDSWETFDACVIREKRAYLPVACHVSKEIKQAFRLPSQEVLLTNLSEAILLGDEKKALSLIQAEAHLWNYCTTKGKINPPLKQQRFSPLMLACFLGQKCLVKALLKMGFVNRPTLQTGETAIFFAMKGKSDDKASLIRLLLAHGAFFNETDKNEMSLLNIAVEENLPECVTRLLKYSKEVREELFTTFTKCPRKSFYHAARLGRFEAISELLQRAPHLIQECVKQLKKNGKTLLAANKCSNLQGIVYGKNLLLQQSKTRKVRHDQILLCK